VLGVVTPTYLVGMLEFPKFLEHGDEVFIVFRFGEFFL